MKQREAARLLTNAGFKPAYHTRHIFWSKGDVSVMVHRGSRFNPNTKHDVLRAIRAAERNDLIIVKESDGMAETLAETKIAEIRRFQSQLTSPAVTAELNRQVAALNEEKVVSREPFARKYSLEDVALIVKRRKEGKSTTLIAAEMKIRYPDITPQKIYSILNNERVRRIDSAIRKKRAAEADRVIASYPVSPKVQTGGDVTVTFNGGVPQVSFNVSKETAKAVMELIMGW